MNKKSFVKYGIILVVVYLVIITFIHFGQKSVDKEHTAFPYVRFVFPLEINRREELFLEL